MFCDFGISGPYLGQMAAVLYRYAPGHRQINLFSDLPPFDAEAASCLLAAYERDFFAPCYFLCVVDPGVGSDRSGLIIRNGDKWFVGPDNGLFSRLQGNDLECWEIVYQPDACSRSFHGRDIFAPVIAQLAAGHAVEEFACPRSLPFVPGDYDDLMRVIYIDHFGNAMTGIDGRAVSHQWQIKIASHCLPYADTFSGQPEGTGFWYINANGLVEIAVNQRSAANVYSLRIGQVVQWQHRN